MQILYRANAELAERAKREHMQAVLTLRITKTELAERAKHVTIVENENTQPRSALNDLNDDAVKIGQCCIKVRIAFREALIIAVAQELSAALTSPLLDSLLPPIETVAQQNLQKLSASSGTARSKHKTCPTNSACDCQDDRKIPSITSKGDATPYSTSKGAPRSNQHSSNANYHDTNYTSTQHM